LTESQEPLRAAVVGLGWMGANHARVYAELPSTSLVAVCDIDRDGAEAVGMKFACNAYTDLAEMLTREAPDIVSVAVPTDLHHRVGTMAIHHGANVLIEKPIAATVADGNQLIQLASERGVRLGVGHVERFNPVIGAMKSAIEAGVLGRIFQITIRRIGPKPDRDRGVGVFLDLATHDIDLVRHLSSSEIDSFASEALSVLGTPHEDLGIGLLRMRNRVLAVIVENWVSPTKVREVAVTGQNGMLVADTITQDLFQYENDYRATDWPAMRNLRGMSEGRMIRHRLQKGEPLRLELEAFARSVIEGVPFPVTGNDGLRALELALRLRTASQADKIVGESDEVSSPC